MEMRMEIAMKMVMDNGNINWGFWARACYPQTNSASNLSITSSVSVVFLDSARPFLSFIVSLCCDYIFIYFN